MAIFYIMFSAHAMEIISELPKNSITRAAASGDLAMVEKFLADGTDSNERNHVGETALMMAALNGHLLVVKKLLTSGADPNYVSVHNQTALDYSNHHTEIFEALLKGGANPNRQDEQGNTVLLKIIRDRTSSLANIKKRELLMQHRANPYIQNNKGESAFNQADDYVKSLVRKKKAKEPVVWQGNK